VPYGGGAVAIENAAIGNVGDHEIIMCNLFE
jgi:hypothetical protein